MDLGAKPKIILSCHPVCCHTSLYVSTALVTLRCWCMTSDGNRSSGNLRLSSLAGSAEQFELIADYVRLPQEGYSTGPARRRSSSVRLLAEWRALIANMTVPELRVPPA